MKTGSIKFEDQCSMSLNELAKKLKPEVEKLVKQVAIKNDLLEIIKKLPID